MFLKLGTSAFGPEGSAAGVDSHPPRAWPATERGRAGGFEAVGSIRGIDRKSSVDGDHRMLAPSAR
jgi:hypothetical protein